MQGISGRRTGWRRLLASMGSALIALASVAAAPSVKAETAPSKPRTLRVSTFKGQPYYVTSYFLSRVAPPDVTIELVETATSAEALDALLTGNTDAAYLGLITSILGVARDRPVVAVASVGRKGTRIVARADSDIRTVKDLAGKNVAVSKSTNQDLILRELLAEAGVDPSKGVSTILLPTNAHVEALMSRTVDAVSTSEPYGSFLLSSGVGRDIAPDLYHTPVGGVGNVLALSRNVVEKDPELAQLITTLHAKATVWARTHPDEVVRELVRVSRQKEDVIRMALANTDLHYNVDDVYLKQAGVLVNELVTAKYLNAPVDVAKVFDLRFLAKAKTAAGEVY